MSRNEDEKPEWLTEIEPDGEDPVTRVMREHDDHASRLEALREFWKATGVASDWLDTPSTGDLPEWATVDEVADLIRLNRKTVIRAIKSGDLPAKKLGQQYRVHVPTIVESFRQQLQQPQPKEGSNTLSTTTRKPKKRKARKRKKRTKKTSRTKVE